MGCTCSRFEADQGTSSPRSASRSGLHQVHVHSANTLRDAHTAGWDPPRKQRIKHGSPTAHQLLTPQQVLELAQRVVDVSFSDGSGSDGGCPDAAMLAAVALVASGGRRDTRHFREDIADTCIGLCQMLRSTASWLASDEGYSRYGTSPSGRDLEQPECCLYFGAAYLRFLSSYNGAAREEGFIIRAFHAGPKQAHSDPGAEAFWVKYARAKQLLLLLQDALQQRASASELGGSQCTMHVVQQGECLRSIAAICNTSITAIMAANPELGGDERCVRPNDCIAIPVPVVLPRLYAVQPGDTLHAIAKAHDCSLSRLMARNPQLTDPANVQPGWLLLAPGLKGDSMSNGTGTSSRLQLPGAEMPDVPGRNTPPPSQAATLAAAMMAASRQVPRGVASSAGTTLAAHTQGGVRSGRRGLAASGARSHLAGQLGASMALPLPLPGLSWVLDDLTAADDDQELGEMLAIGNSSEAAEGRASGLQAARSAPRLVAISRV